MEAGVGLHDGPFGANRIVKNLPNHVFGCACIAERWGAIEVLSRRSASKKKKTSWHDPTFSQKPDFVFFGRGPDGGLEGQESARKDSAELSPRVSLDLLAGDYVHYNIMETFPVTLI